MFGGCGCHLASRWPIRASCTLTRMSAPRVVMATPQSRRAIMPCALRLAIDLHADAIWLAVSGPSWSGQIERVARIHRRIDQLLGITPMALRQEESTD